MILEWLEVSGAFVLGVGLRTTGRAKKLFELTLDAILLNCWPIKIDNNNVDKIGNENAITFWDQAISDILFLKKI